MKSITSIVAVSLLAISVSAMAQNLSLPSYMTADHNMRTSKVIGMTVYNEKNENIGKIDDILLPEVAGGEVSAVLSVGGFVGAGQKMVKVPLSHVHFVAEKPMMPGGDKPALIAMPDYSYNSNVRGGG